MNHVSISGRLGRDPELMKTSTGLSACNLSLGVKRSHAKEGEQDTDWITVKAWRQNADYISEHAEKGDLIGVEGRLQSESYTGRDGIKRIATYIVADHIEILSSVSKRSGSGGSGSMGNESLSRKDIKPATKEETAELYGVDADDLPF